MKVLRLISLKWMYEIVMILDSGTMRFRDIRTKLPGISNRVLDARLKELIDIGMVDKVVVSIVPIITHYCLAERGVLLTNLYQDLGKYGVQIYGEEYRSPFPKVQRIYI